MKYLATYLQRLTGRRAAPGEGGHGTRWSAFAKYEKWPKQQVAVPARLPERERSHCLTGRAERDSLPRRQLVPLIMNTNDTNPLERYSRQMRFPGIGKAGQEQLLAAASRSAAAARSAPCWPTPWSAPASASSASSTATSSSRQQPPAAGALRRVRRREQPAEGRGRREQAAADQLVGHVEPVVADIDRTNIEELCKDADLILDGTDNFEIRYLINDVAVKLGKPWVYGGAVGSQGQTMTIIPGETPCLRCVFEAAPAPGEAGTCETAGVLGPDRQHRRQLPGGRGAEDPRRATRTRSTASCSCSTSGRTRSRRIKIAPLAGRKVDCPCCAQRKFEWLEGEHGTQTTTPVRPQRGAGDPPRRRPARLRGPGRCSSKQSGAVSFNQFLLKFNLVENGEYEFTVFPDGRAIIKGTSDAGQGPDAVREVHRALTRVVEPLCAVVCWRRR